jgi:hypothetical protein
MKKMSLTLPILVGVMLSWAISANAVYSGLVNIPTADVLGEKAFAVSAQPLGPASDLAANLYIDTQMGIIKGLEAGIDFNLEAKPKLAANVKYSPDYDLYGGKAAVGFYNLADGAKVIPYAVYTKGFEGFRVHAGIIKPTKNVQVMVGADAPAMDKVTVMADYVSGTGSPTTVGFNYQATPEFGVLPGVYFVKGSKPVYTAYITYAGSIK